MKNKTQIALLIIKNNKMELIEWKSNWYKSYDWYWRDCLLLDLGTGEEIFDSICINPQLDLE